MIDFAIDPGIGELRDRVGAFIREVVVAAEDRDTGEHGLDDCLRRELQEVHGDFRLGKRDVRRPDASPARRRARLWYEVLALWKSAIFLEPSHRRLRKGRADEPCFASLGHGVPEAARAALAATART